MATQAIDFREAIAKPDEFSKLCQRRIQLKALIAEAEEEIKETLDPAITQMLVDNDTIKVQYGEVAVSLVEGRRSSLSKEKLVERGVEASLIAECTTTTVYSYLLIR